MIYSLEERNKLVFMVEARTETPDGLRVGQPVSVALKGAAWRRRNDVARHRDRGRGPDQIVRRSRRWCTISRCR